MELLEKLAALIPRPRINLVLYHGVLAPHARWRARVVACGVSATISPALPRGLDEPSEEATPPLRPRHWAWASLMRRAFDVDVLACPRCGGRLRLVATIEDPGAIQAVLAALQPSAESADRAPPLAESLDTGHSAEIRA